jgi:hypothetical protein
VIHPLTENGQNGALPTDVFDLSNQISGAQSISVCYVAPINWIWIVNILAPLSL